MFFQDDGLADDPVAIRRATTSFRSSCINRRKPEPSWPHSNTTFLTQIYIRWRCIDRLSWHR
jgi:hypothetical protein